LGHSSDLQPDAGGLGPGKFIYKGQKQDFYCYLNKVIHNQGREQCLYRKTKRRSTCLVDNFLNTLKKFRHFFGKYFGKAE